MKIQIFGDIINSDNERSTAEDFSVAQLDDAVSRLADGEDLEIDITSFGGSATAAIAMSNLLKQASSNGHKTCAHVIGIAASSASAIACACDELHVDSNAFLMLHLPWSAAMGNSLDFRKEADVLDQYRDAFVAIYKLKMPDKAQDEIVKMLEDETWVLGSQADALGIVCTTVDTGEQIFSIAASAKPFARRFKHMPKEILADEESVPLAEVEKRVSGMQSAMAKQLNELKAELDAKTQEFEIQMQARDQELVEAKASATSLAAQLESSR